MKQEVKAAVVPLWGRGRPKVVAWWSRDGREMIA